ncbi:bactofilin family protein [Lacisediminimonas profundi]|uniref:bactofilin family protein n=1 Tax=Lacisediminimonas profundi TaxID=2603856 RepID=UPI00124AFF70|nr:polymer-forming cytoskeletal protein [Lacisediminimonas profundi]
MLRSETLFGKREPNPSANTSNPPLSATTPPSGGAGVKSTLSSAAGSSLSSPSAAKDAAANTASTNAMGSKLIVGPNIKLKGVEITDCDTLVVEGCVEATMDSRVMQIAEIGAFKGSAEIDIAEIRGAFDGDLVVREKLVIYATGKVSGKIRYGKLVIEEGGQIMGDVQVNGAAVTAPRALNAA